MRSGGSEGSLITSDTERCCDESDLSSSESEFGSGDESDDSFAIRKSPVKRSPEEEKELQNKLKEVDKMMVQGLLERYTNINAGTEGTMTG